ncbi:MAG: class B sortase, partial [Clostridia bacterium]|nr:class B sortase [Clostridia bacterium]
MRVKRTYLLPVILLVAGVMAIAGSLLMQEWQIRQDAQEYEQLVLEVRASVQPSAELERQDAGAAGTSPSEELFLHPTEIVKITPVPSALPTAAEATLKPTFPSQSEQPTISPAASSSQASGTSNTGIDLAALKSTNSDFIAWLHIPGTKIDYPVVLTDDVEHYLTHSFSGKESICGTLFSLSRTDYRAPSRNIAIFGHHMRRSRSQTMFQPLHNYKDSSYYHKHSTITLDSLYRSETYTIFAVLNMCESDWDASTADFSTDEAFLSFLERAKELSFYDTDVSV